MGVWSNCLRTASVLSVSDQVTNSIRVLYSPVILSGTMRCLKSESTAKYESFGVCCLVCGVLYCTFCAMQVHSWTGSLQIGVTTNDPSTLKPTPPNALDIVNRSWVGYLVCRVSHSWCQFLCKMFNRFSQDATCLKTVRLWWKTMALIWMNLMRETELV